MWRRPGAAEADPAPCCAAKTVCSGRTGAVTRFTKASQRRIVTGLPSYAPSNGEGATGPHDVSVPGRKIYVPIGLERPTVLRPALIPIWGGSSAPGRAVRGKGR